MNTGKCCALTDQDRVEDMITSEKYLMNVYSSFIPEASCKQLKSVLTDNFNGCAQNQAELFDRMSQLGWYPEKCAPKPEVDAAKQKFQQLKSKMSACTAD